MNIETITSNVALQTQEVIIVDDAGVVVTLPQPPVTVLGLTIIPVGKTYRFVIKSGSLQVNDHNNNTIFFTDQVDAIIDMQFLDKWRTVSSYGL